MNSIEPTLPKKRIERKKWTQPEIDLLLSMVDGFKSEGIRPRWREIAAATGHHDNSCVVKYQAIRSREADLKARAEIDKRIAEREARPTFRAPDPGKLPLVARVSSPDFGVGVSTARLKADAEMRARIEILGVTGGLLGDPLPGRSVLDKRRAGIVDDLPPSNHREVYYASRPKITLATEPLR